MENFNNTNRWFSDKLAPHRVILHEIEREIYSGATKFQKVRIFQSPAFGKILALDEDLQSTQFDEFIYHETLVHSGMLTHPDPRRVLIIGGGEGATLRECLKYKRLEKAVMVDIDEELVSLCKEYLPEWSDGAFSDKRTVVFYRDAREFVENCDEKFDVIISDLTEPVPDSPARFLLTKEFFQAIKDKLNNPGIFIIQASMANLMDHYFHSIVFRTLSKVFPLVRSLGVFIPSFCNRWGFITASEELDPFIISEEDFISSVEDKIDGELSFYDYGSHRYTFSLYKPLKLALEKQKKILTDEDTDALKKIYKS